MHAGMKWRTFIPPNTSQKNYFGILEIVKNTICRGYSKNKLGFYGKGKNLFLAWQIMNSSTARSWLCMKAMTTPRCRAEICHVRNIFFLSRSTKRCNSIFCLLYHLQIVLLTFVYTKIHYFYRNNDFNGDLTCVRGMKAPAAPAMPLALVAVLPSFFSSWLLKHLYWGIFTRNVGKDDS